jgi:general secretion pathway protein D
VSEQTIQLKDGEPSILAGLLEKSETRINTGTPGLAEIPWVKYLFGSQSKEVVNDEVVFVLIPHIVRESVLTRLNTRAIDTGTGASVELRRDPNPATDLENYIEPNPVKKPIDASTAANVASAMVQQMAAAATRPALPSASTPLAGIPNTTAAAGGSVGLSVVPANSAQSIGSTFQVAVNLANGHDIYSVPMQMQFDPKVLELVNVDAGDFLTRDGQAVAIVHRDEGNGLVTISTSRPPGLAGLDGQGTICTLTFKAKAAGDSNLTLVKVGAKNSTQVNLPAVGSQAVVHVK